MTYRASKSLLRDFLEALFAALSIEGIAYLTWPSSETDARFRSIYDFLTSRAHTNDDVARLAALLRPDPLSGLVSAVGEALIYLQPGVVSAPNPSEIKLVATRGQAAGLRDELPTEVGKLLDGAVKAFLGREHQYRETVQLRHHIVGLNKERVRQVVREVAENMARTAGLADGLRPYDTTYSGRLADRVVDQLCRENVERDDHG